MVLPECRADDQCATPGPCEHADGAVCRAGQCRYQAKLPNASCDDGNACTDADTCNAVRVCSGVARVCNTPPSSVCIADDTIFRTYSSPGACDPADGQCVYQFDDQGCAGCTVNCLYCDEHADCAPGGYCDADQQCTPRRADGGDCSGIGAEACVSRYCNGGLCCGHGDCCNNPGDCAPSYDGVSRCTDTTPATSCQGTRLERACEEHVCTSAPIDDDSGCAGIEHACANNLAPIVCTAEASQGLPVCASGCTVAADCDDGFRCDPPTCVLPADTGSSCTGVGQGTCEPGLRCQNGVCCAMVGPTCCATDAHCASGLACNDTIAACYVSCNNYDSSRCASASEYCYGNACVPRLANGSACVAAGQCTSTHCQNGFCCASGDCCFAATDCPSSYTLPSSCDVVGPTTTCQGTREDAVCANNTCARDASDDDSGCTGEARACPDNLAPVLCTADVGQPVAACPNGCVDDLDCLPGTICVAPSCVVPVVVVEPVYAGNPNWNDYVVNSQPALAAYHQADVACTGNEVGFDACLHAGELRKVVVSVVSACADVVLAEDLGVFTWVCEDNGGAGPVVFYSTGFAAGRGLAHLVGANGFRDNAVTVTRGGQVVAYSTPGVWGWANPVQPLPDNSGGAVASLAQAGAVYTLAASRTSSGYNVNADRVSLVTLGDAVLTYSGSSARNCNAAGEVGTESICQVAAGSQRFLWLEGSFDADASIGTDAQHHLLLATTTFSRVHRFSGLDASAAGVLLAGQSRQNRVTGATVRGSGDDGLVVKDTSAFNHVEALTVHAAEDSGVALYDSAHFNRFVDVVVELCGSGDHAGLYVNTHDNRFYRVRAYGNTVVGLRIGGWRNVVVGAYLANNYTDMRQWTSTGPQNNTYVGVFAAHGDSGLYLQNGVFSTLSHVTAVNNLNNGMRLGNADVPAQQHTFNNFLSLHSDDGVDFYNSPTSGGHVIHRLAALHNSHNVRVGSPGNTFTGDLWGSAASNNCNVVGGITNSGIIDNTCTSTGADGSSSYPGQLSNAVLHINVDVTSSFAGRVTTDDAVNQSDNAGSGSAASIGDWSGFESPFRTWGPEATSFLDSAALGECTGSCRIWDWRLVATDTRLLNLNGAFVADAACPASVHGDRVITDRQSPANTFLINAIERVLDGVGDDDGLCESGETCVYAPNIGAYQGDGEPTARCTFVGGVVTGVTMLAHPSNGVD